MEKKKNQKRKERWNKTTRLISKIPQKLPANKIIILACSAGSSIVSFIALTFSAVLNNNNNNNNNGGGDGGARDTLQTWTCRWRHITGEGVPRQFDTLCHETVSFSKLLSSSHQPHQLTKSTDKTNIQRFAFYTTIPTFLLQLLLLSLAVQALRATRREAATRRSGLVGDEKGVAATAATAAVAEEEEGEEEKEKEKAFDEDDEDEEEHQGKGRR